MSDKPEMAIITHGYRKFDCLVAVERCTGKRMYHRVLTTSYNLAAFLRSEKPPESRLTFCDMRNVIVRNATVDMFAELIEMEYHVDTERSRVMSALVDRQRSETARIAEKFGGTVL
jgi:hypothetical protein